MGGLFRNPRVVRYCGGKGGVDHLLAKRSPVTYYLLLITFRDDIQL